MRRARREAGLPGRVGGWRDHRVPPDDGRHEAIVVAVDDWLRDVHGLRLHRNLTLISQGGEYVPDGIAAPKGAFAGREWHSKPDGVAMVLEMTSKDRRDHKGAERDRGPKRRGYAAADIPLYLLIDRLDGKATIFSSRAALTTPTSSRSPWARASPSLPRSKA
ncbi:Uma2 family endonuclease [Actinomadura luteofluorescens]|uniref:Uma2 family endonuclease n=1 Tax=Actinomadura luteofluorescens TaxID=46163 RepID=UPI003D8FE678